MSILEKYSNSNISEDVDTVLNYIKDKEEEWIRYYDQITNYNENNPHSQLAKWPLVVMLFGGIMCLGCSASYHLFTAHSKKINSLLGRLDYAGISILIMCSCYPPCYYLFYCDFSKHNLKLFFIINFNKRICCILFSFNVCNGFYCVCYIC